MSRKTWKPNRRERRVLLALLTGASNLSGYPLSQVAQVGDGYVYLVLARLEGFGWVTSEWEEGPAQQRRLYQLTPMGRERAMLRLGLKVTDA